MLLELRVNLAGKVVFNEVREEAYDVSAAGFGYSQSGCVICVRETRSRERAGFPDSG